MKSEDGDPHLLAFNPSATSHDKVVDFFKESTPQPAVLSPSHPSIISYFNDVVAHSVT